MANYFHIFGFGKFTFKNAVLHPIKILLEVNSYFIYPFYPYIINDYHIQNYHHIIRGLYSFSPRQCFTSLYSSSLMSLLKETFLSSPRCFIVVDSFSLYSPRNIFFPFSLSSISPISPLKQSSPSMFLFTSLKIILSIIMGLNISLMSRDSENRLSKGS